MTLTLGKAPSDIISRAMFADNQHLLVSSWDKSLYLYDTDRNHCVYSFATDAPVLDCAFYLVRSRYNSLVGQP